MFVIEARDSEGRIIDVYTSDEIREQKDTIAFPLRKHFAADRIMPFICTAFFTSEEAVERLPLAVAQWSSAEYQKYEGIAASAQVVHINEQENPNGYIIAGTSDEEVREKIFETYNLAIKAYRALLRKKKKHRGEEPYIAWGQTKGMHEVVNKENEDFDDDVPF